MPAQDGCETDFGRDGAQYYPGAIEAQLSALRAALAGSAEYAAGARLHDVPELSSLLSIDGSISQIACSKIGETARPVRAILLNKTRSANWSLGWHQDRTICVKKRVTTDGYGPWTVKRGLCHVEPPFDVIKNMVTIRLHLDDVSHDNAPLLVALGSHKFGKITAPKAKPMARSCKMHTCLANAGDAWLYSTPILHASKASQKPRSRLVLQVDYASNDLPNGLEWLGV